MSDLLPDYPELLELVQQLVHRASQPELIEGLEQMASRYLGAPVTVHTEMPSGPCRILAAGNGRILGYMACEPSKLGGPLAELLVGLCSLALDWCQANEVPRSSFVAELIAARTVLAEMLPSGSLQLGDCSAAGWLQAVHYVGGDCYDFFATGEELRFFIADAVGHGLAATMMSLECRALWRALSRTRPPAQTAEIINELLAHGDRGQERFVACCLGELNRQTSLIRYVCCGLAPCVHRRSDGTTDILEAADPPLGVIRAASFREHQRDFVAGDAALFLTDGVLDCLQSDGTRYGQARIRTLVARLEPEAILEGLRQDLKEFAGDHPQQDDAAALLISRF